MQGASHVETARSLRPRLNYWAILGGWRCLSTHCTSRINAVRVLGRLVLIAFECQVRDS